MFSSPIDDETGWWPWGRPSSYNLKWTISGADEPYVIGYYDEPRKVFVEEIWRGEVVLERYENGKRVDLPATSAVESTSSSAKTKYAAD
jgi:hypothetical protein